MKASLLAFFGAALLVSGWVGPGDAEEPPSLAVRITYLGRDEPPRQTLSLADPVLTDEGLRGVEQAVGDNETTGRFLGHRYELSTRTVPRGAAALATLQAGLAAGERYYVLDLPASDLATLTGPAEAAGALLFNARAADDSLRVDGCSPALFHTAASRAMKADALAQYLLWKRWTRWFLVVGSHPEDALMGAALKRSAERYGARLVEERVFEDTGGGRRTDTGHVRVQSQMPVFTQNAGSYDVLVAADESDVFGDYLPYRTWDARPVVGTSGLVATAWSRVNEQWGATQMQRRFERRAKRPMTERDFAAWAATRAIGEAVTRTGSADPGRVHDHLVGDAFELAAFKGQALTFRRWDQQLRQPMLLVTPRSLVSVSPQEGYLHQRTPLDTLGHDEPDSRCRLNP